MDTTVSPSPAAAPVGPLTLAIDVGGTRLKAGVLDAAGALVGVSVRTDTPQPSPPGVVVEALIGLARQLGPFDRVSVGFPGVVRKGSVLTAPNLGTPAWRGYPLAPELARRLERPVRMLNDATVQGLGVVAGRGLEVVVTLGTGFGFAMFQDGCVAPHLELSHHPVRKRKDYDQWIGNAELRRIGAQRWNRRVRKAIGYVATLTNFDTLYIGGGNAKLLDFEPPPGVKVVSNTAGITGGVRLWDPALDPAFAEQDPAVQKTLQRA